MRAALEILAIIFGLGIPVTFLAWPFIPAVIVKAAGGALIAYVTGYSLSLGLAYVEGFVTALRRQRRG